MATTDEVKKAREEVTKLDQKVRAARRKVSADVTDRENDVALAQLNSEKARLQAELDALSGVASVKEQAAAIITQIESGGETPPAPVEVPTDADAKKNRGDK